jgi:hypothetical protein
MMDPSRQLRYCFGRRNLYPAKFLAMGAKEQRTQRLSSAKSKVDRQRILHPASSMVRWFGWPARLWRAHHKLAHHDKPFGGVRRKSAVEFSQLKMKN